MMLRPSFGTLVVLLQILAFCTAELRTIDAEAFKKRRQSSGVFVASFCMPWYDPCKTLELELQKAAESLSLWNVDVLQVDCVKDAALCSSQTVNSYPAIRVFEGEDYARYRGKLKAPPLTRYVLKRVLGSVADADATKLDVLMNLDIPLMLLVRGLDELGNSLGEFSSVSQKLSDKFFLAATEEATLRDEVTRRPPHIKVFNAQDEAAHVYKGEIKEDSILQFAERIGSPLVGKLDLTSLGAYMKSGLPLAMIFSEDEAERSNVAVSLKDVAWKYRDRVNFVTVDAANHGFLVEPLGLRLGEYPAFSVQTRDNVFPFDQSKEITMTEVDEFLRNALQQRESHGEL